MPVDVTPSFHVTGDFFFFGGGGGGGEGDFPNGSNLKRLPSMKCRELLAVI